jgi:spermidine/putrescine transport system substrate-binding protein
MVIPKEGVLFFVDNLCIPKSAPNKETAELFIDFLMRPRNSARNIETIMYAMPNLAAKELLPDSVRNNPVIFPSDQLLRNMNLIKDQGEFNLKLEEAWTKLKIK